MGAPTKAWQVRLSPKEDEAASQLASKHAISKNDVVRRGVRLLAFVEGLSEDGHRLLVHRRGRNQEDEAIEVWLI